VAAAAGGAPAVRTRSPRRTPWRSSAGALAIPIRTVGPAHSIVICSALISSKIPAGSTRRRQTCLPPTAVIIQTNVQPLQWNIGSVHRYVSPADIDTCASVPTALMYALRWVIITPFGRDVVPLV